MFFFAKKNLPKGVLLDKGELERILFVSCFFSVYTRALDEKRIKRKLVGRLRDYDAL